MIQTWGRMMTNPDLQQSRLQWLSGDLGTSKDSDTIYFVGCIPYFDPLFQKIGVEGVEIAKAAIKILNHLGIEPQVFSNERCCGHDQLWEGDVDTFRALATLNLEMFISSGAKRIVTTCPECARTIKMDYPKFVGNHGLEVMHLSELLTSTDMAHSLPQKANNRRITYQDPCHLGRHLGVYDAPRKVLSNLGYDISEMRRNRNASLCCGSSCWRACGQVSKHIQVDRLEEARSTGADLLVTACLKCQIHLKCAQNDPIRRDEINIEIQDMTTLIAENL
jgi:Fe-S oxidoreductase